jgi:hypothetical protein
MANGKKEYLGIVKNKVDLQGPVAEDPRFFEIEGGEGAFLKIKTSVSEIDANGQRVDAINEVPVYVMDVAKARVVKNYVKAGKRLSIDAYCKVWPDGTLGLVASFIQLGSGPPRQQQDQVPPLPAG